MLDHIDFFKTTVMTKLIMEMIIIIYIQTLWASLHVCTHIDLPSNNITDTICTVNTDSLLVNIGYPKPGDIPLLNRKVFKGIRVSIREHPYVVSIRRRYAHYVTGALLTKNLVISVAHPLIDVPITELGVVVGENYADRGTVILTVILLISHEDFDPYTLNADIALLRIYEDVTYRGSIKSIGLVAPRMPLANNKAFVTGWGRCDRTGTELCLFRSSKYFPDEKFDPMLRTISFNTVLPSLYCEGYKRHDINIKPGMLCVGPAREEDPVCPCLAVPGAPLVIGARLAGLQSWGFGCGYDYDLPLVYTSIQYYQPWLIHNIPILRNIKQDNVTPIFEATRAYIIMEWLMETRLVKPDVHALLDKELEPLKVDTEIAKLRGSVYDVRDYINNGLYHSHKSIMYKSLKARTANIAKMKAFDTPKLQSFLSNYLLKDFNNGIDNLISNNFSINNERMFDDADQSTNFSEYENSELTDDD